MGVSKTSDNIQIKNMMPNPSKETPMSSHDTNMDLKDMDIICNFKIKIVPKLRKWGYQRPMTK